MDILRSSWYIWWDLSLRRWRRLQSFLGRPPLYLYIKRLQFHNFFLITFQGLKNLKTGHSSIRFILNQIHDNIL